VIPLFLGDQDFSFNLQSDGFLFGGIPQSLSFFLMAFLSLQMVATAFLSVLGPPGT